MKVIRHSENSTLFNQGTAITIGNFDAVHLGHQQIIRRLNEESNSRQLASVLMTFFPNPKNYFRPAEKRSARLTTLSDRFFALRPLNLDAIYVAKFDAKLANTSAENFVLEYLVAQLNTKYILIGDDFRFGANRIGDFDLLAKMGEQHGFVVERFDSYCIDGQRVSSSTIRQLLKQGELSKAKRLLGRPYSISGRVVHGDKRGRNLGFATMNLPVRTLSPLNGVYLVSIKGLDKGVQDKIYWGVANIGSRPTIDGQKQLLEVHVFNFSNEVYGQRICVEFHQHIRAEKKFDSLAQLSQQIQNDVLEAKSILISQGKRK